MKVSVATTLCCLAHTTLGMLQVPQWISDGMVLQSSGGDAVLSDTAAVLNGMSDVGKVVVKVGSESYSVDTDASGNWTAQFKTPASTTPTTITITNQGGDTISINDVLFGDVYFCAGQSNMVFPMENAINATEEVATLKYFPNFRFFKTPIAESATPQTMLKGGNWVNSTYALSSGYFENFSAMCYLTAREVARLHTGVNRPVGLVQSAVSGTRVEAWMPSEAFDLCPQYKGKIPTAGGGNAAMALYNGMVNPFIQMSVRVGLWYQGEHNAKQVDEAGVDKQAYYTCLYHAMIQTWRKMKGIGNFPWMTEQLPPSKESGQSGQLSTGWIPVRLAEKEVTVMTPSAGMAVGIDLGGVSAWGSLHPADKNEMSKRMALQAVRGIYNITTRMSAPALGDYMTAYSSYWSGPVEESITLTSKGVEIVFNSDTANGLNFQDTSEHNTNNTTPCTLCCAKSPPFEVFQSGNWTTVPLSSITTTGNTLVLSGYTEAKAVRYANSDFVECVLYNSDALPLGPFVYNITN